MIEKTYVRSAAFALALTIIELSTSAAMAADTASTPPPTAYAAYSDGNTERVRTLFREGNAQMVAGNYEGARASLLQAWALRQSSDIAGALGQIELATKHYRDAAEHLQWCLAHFPPVESEKVLHETRQLFDQAKLHVAQLRLTANRDRISIAVDGKTIGVTPLPAPLFVEPGLHSIEARLNGVRDTRTIGVDAGKEYGIDFAFKPAETTGNARAMASKTVAQQQTVGAAPGRSVVPVIIGGAAFAVALGAGIALLDSSSSSYDDARALQSQIGPAGCSSPSRNSGFCAELKAASEKGDSRERWGVVALATAGVALVAFPVYWFWPRDRDETTRAQWRIRGSVAREYSGLWLTGDF